uniref:Uncharacterized protein n=1 Tax=Sexangularia sp. CB-2014 TaxID=1486929 RepID=A0A7S1YCV7_9EUKA
MPSTTTTAPVPSGDAAPSGPNETSVEFLASELVRSAPDWTYSYLKGVPVGFASTVELLPTIVQTIILHVLAALVNLVQAARPFASKLSNKVSEAGVTHEAALAAVHANVARMRAVIAALPKEGERVRDEVTVGVRDRVQSSQQALADRAGAALEAAAAAAAVLASVRAEVDEEVASRRRARPDSTDADEGADSSAASWSSLRAKGADAAAEAASLVRAARAEYEEYVKAVGAVAVGKAQKVRAPALELYYSSTELLDSLLVSTLSVLDRTHSIAFIDTAADKASHVASVARSEVAILIRDVKTGKVLESVDALDELVVRVAHPAVASVLRAVLALYPVRLIVAIWISVFAQLRAVIASIKETPEQKGTLQ